MKPFPSIVIGVLFLGIGGLIGWSLRANVPNAVSVSLPEYGGTIGLGFSAEVTSHPETEIEGESFTMHETTWKWVFRNLSDAPIQFSIPTQMLRLLPSEHGILLTEIPESLLVDPPVTIAPGESKEYSAKCGRISWQKAKSDECGFQLVAKINDRFHILGCAANIRAAPKGNKP
jgi:hypothetical protein